MANDGFYQFTNALLSLTADGVEFVTLFAEIPGKPRDLLDNVWFVALIEDDDLLFLREVVTEFGEFSVEGFEVADGIAVCFTPFELASDFDNMHEDAGTFEVFKKIVTESFAVTGADNEAGHIGNDEGVVLEHFDDAQVWCEGSKGIVGDSRFCV